MSPALFAVWSGGRTALAAAECRVAETDVLTLSAGLQQAPEAVGVLDGGDRVVALWKGHVGVGVVVDVADRANADRLARFWRAVVVCGEGVRQACARPGLVALRSGLAAGGGASYEPERRERDLALRSVRIGDGARLEDPVVVLGTGGQPGGVGHEHRQEVVVVVGDRGAMTVGVAWVPQGVTGFEQQPAPSGSRAAVEVVAAPSGLREPAAGFHRAAVGGGGRAYPAPGGSSA